MWQDMYFAFMFRSCIEVGGLVGCGSKTGRRRQDWSVADVKPAQSFPTRARDIASHVFDSQCLLLFTSQHTSSNRDHGRREQEPEGSIW